MDANYLWKPGCVQYVKDPPGLLPDSISLYCRYIFTFCPESRLLDSYLLQKEVIFCRRPWYNPQTHELTSTVHENKVVA